MRLWHKDLIPVLPKQQLIAQWRECCCIARNISVNGTPNHLLVNKIMEYSTDHLWNYTNLVIYEMKERGYKVDIEKFLKHYRTFGESWPTILDEKLIYKSWHNDRYFIQCYFNLQEKYDCGGISEDEWEKIHHLMEEKIIFKRGAKS